jgi:hypothetical protein
MNSPPKKRAAVLEPPKAAEPAGEYFACTHSATRVEVMPDGHTHHAREVCVHCGAFTRWLPRPETAERRRLNGYRLARLGMCPSLNRWEANFVQSVSQCKKLSYRQQQNIDRLCAKYLDRERVA